MVLQDPVLEEAVVDVVRLEEATEEADREGATGDELDSIVVDDEPVEERAARRELDDVVAENASREVDVEPCSLDVVTSMEDTVLLSVTRDEEIGVLSGVDEAILWKQLRS